jgi:hypothetical protein
VLGSGGLAHPKLAGDLVDLARSLPQEVEDAQPVGACGDLSNDAWSSSMSFIALGIPLLLPAVTAIVGAS